MPERSLRWLLSAVAAYLLALIGALAWLSRPRPQAAVVESAPPDLPIPQTSSTAPKPIPVWRVIGGLLRLALLIGLLAWLLPDTWRTPLLIGAALVNWGASLALNGRDAAQIAALFDARRAFWTRALSIAGWLLIIVGALALRDTALPLQTGLRVAAAGGLALIGAWWLHPVDANAASAGLRVAPTIELAGWGVRWRGLIAGIAALSMVAYCGIVEGVLPTALQAMLWLGGGVVVAWALSGGFDTETQRHRENTKAQRHKGAKKFFSLLLTPHSLLFLLALTLRLWDLEYAVYTPALELDQVQGVVWLRDDLHRGLLQPYLYNSVPALYPFVQRVTSLVVGANYTALRLVSAVIGALTIPALYELLRTLLLRGLIRDERSAIPLVGALLLACFPPHLHFSRLGMIHIAAPLFGTLALALWARALQNGDRRAAAYGGLALGLTPYFFPFGLLVFPLLCAALWIVFLSRGSMRRWLMLSGVFAAAALAWSAPLLYVQQTRGALPAQESSDGLLTLEHLLRTEETFIVASPTYGGDQALLVAALLPFVLAGFAVACADRRLWVLALWGIGAVITPFTSSAGLTLAFPALSALAALGIGRALPLVGVQNQHKDTTAQWHNGFVFQAAPYIVVLLLGITQVSDYFGRHLALFNEQIRPVFDPYDAMQRARAYPPRTWVQIVGSMEFSGWLSILRAYWEMPGDVYIVRPEDFTLSYLQRIPRDWDVVFFVTPGDTAAQQLIGDWYIAPRVIEPAPSNVPARRRYRQIEVDTPYD